MMCPSNSIVMLIRVQIESSTNLEVHISSFDDKSALSTTHVAVILKLKRALNSFAVEQQLEKYRYLGGGHLTENELRTISKILPETKHQSIDIPLSYFVPKSKSLVLASNPTGTTENDLDHGYSTLLAQLGEICTSRASSASFLALDECDYSQVIPYWCFVQVIRSSGVVVIKAKHPAGTEAAQQVIQRTREMVMGLCHKTNQILLLEDLYKTRSACNNLLIADEVAAENKEEMGIKSAVPTFACPVQYRKTMDVNIRCTPRQAIESLISSTLHNFLVSNRRWVFVYKDEDNRIYYMQLTEHSHTIELCVHGLNIPGASITTQLVCLLKKQLLLLPLNTLSSVLTKNPYFALLPSDVKFLREFDGEMAKLDGGYDSCSVESKRLYELPSYIQDPLLVLLLFRRNITGSTL